MTADDNRLTNRAKDSALSQAPTVPANDIRVFIQRSLDWATKPNRWLPQPGWAAPPWMIPTPGFLATGSGRS